jgi:hypothetical protein
LATAAKQHYCTAYITISVPGWSAAPQRLIVLGGIVLPSPSLAIH